MKEDKKMGKSGGNIGKRPEKQESPRIIHRYHVAI